MAMATAEHVNHQCIREPWTIDVTTLAALGRLARAYSNISQIPVISLFSICELLSEYQGERGFALVGFYFNCSIVCEHNCLGYGQAQTNAI